MSEILRNEKGLEIGEKAYVFAATDLNGREVSIESQHVLLIFFNSTCDACKITAPRWQELYDKYSSKNIKIIAISKEVEQTTRKFAFEHGLSLPILLDPDQKIRQKYRVKYFPQIVMVDPGGRINFYQSFGTGAKNALSEAERILQDIDEMSRHSEKSTMK